MDLIHGCHGAKLTGLNQRVNDEAFLLYLYSWTVCFVCQARFGTTIADVAMAIDSDGVARYVHVVITLEIERGKPGFEHFHYFIGNFLT